MVSSTGSNAIVTPSFFAKLAASSNSHTPSGAQMMRRGLSLRSASTYAASRSRSRCPGVMSCGVWITSACASIASAAARVHASDSAMCARRSEPSFVTRWAFGTRSMVLRVSGTPLRHLRRVSGRGRGARGAKMASPRLEARRAEGRRSTSAPTRMVMGRDLGRSDGP